MESFTFFLGAMVGAFFGMWVLQGERDQAREAGVMCFDAVSGERIWSKNCPEAEQ